METKDSKLAAYYGLDLQRYRIFQLLRLEQDPMNEAQKFGIQLRLCLAPFESERQNLLELWFGGVSDLVFTQPSEDVFSIYPITIVRNDVSGWVDETYSVYHDEQDAILRLTCREFSARLVPFNE